MPGSRRRDASRQSPTRPAPPRQRQGNVCPIEGWVEPLRCALCGGGDIVQVDLIECAYPVLGVRKPWDAVVIEPAESTLDVTAVGQQFYRCRDCESEWDVEPGTQFTEPDDQAS